MWPCILQYTTLHHKNYGSTLRDYKEKKLATKKTVFKSESTEVCANKEHCGLVILHVGFLCPPQTSQLQHDMHASMHEQ